MEFEWDEWNLNKNWERHGVSAEEAEDVFSDPNKAKYPDPGHSNTESRFVLVGQTRTGRKLFVIYTSRENRIRVISARDLNKKRERHLYEKAFSATKI